MSGGFNALREWLGISLDEQPPSHYQLLGLKPFEHDDAKIERAAQRQSSKLKQHSEGPHAAEAKQTLGEIAAAKATLLDPNKRRLYDHILRKKLGVAAPTHAGPAGGTAGSASAASKGAPSKSSPKLASKSSPKLPVAKALETTESARSSASGSEPDPLAALAALAAGEGAKTSGGKVSSPSSRRAGSAKRTKKHARARATAHGKERPAWLIPSLAGGGGLLVLIVVLIAMGGRGGDDSGKKVARGKDQPRSGAAEKSKGSGPVTRPSSGAGANPIQTTGGSLGAGTADPWKPVDEKNPADGGENPFGKLRNPGGDPNSGPPQTEPHQTKPPTTGPPTSEPPKTEPPKTGPPATDPNAGKPGGSNPPTEQNDGGGPPAKVAPVATKPLSMKELIARVEPGIVVLTVDGDDGRGTGSGFVVDGDGTVVTNYHVVQGARRITAEFNNGEKVEVIGYLKVDPGHDLALIRVARPKRAFTILPLADKLPSKGDDVVTFGAPQGLKFTTTDGIVSAIRRGDEIQRVLFESYRQDIYRMLGYHPNALWIQTSAPISGGNSGGPLVDMYGRVVGVNTWRHVEGQNLNFAGAVEMVRDILRYRGRVELQPLAKLPREKVGVAHNPRTPPGSEKIDPNAPELPKEVLAKTAAGEVHKLTLHEGGVFDLDVSKDGRSLLTTGADKTARLTNLSTLKEVKRLNAQDVPFTGVSFSPFRQLVFLTTGDPSPANAMARNHVFWVWNPESPVTEVLRIHDSVMSGYAIAVSQDGRRIVTGHAGGIANYRRLEEIRDSHLLRHRNRQTPCTAVAISPDGRYTATACATGTIYMWQPDLGRPSGEMVTHAGGVRSLQFSKDGRYLLTAGGDGTARVWSNWTTNGGWRQVAIYKGLKGAVTSARFSPDGKFVAAAGADGRVLVWGTDSGKLKREFKGHNSAVMDVEFLKSGHYVVSAGMDGSVRFWNLGTRQPPPGSVAGKEPSDPKTSPSFKQPEKKADQPIPDSAELAKANKLIAEIFRARYEKAKTSAERVRVARDMFEQAQAEGIGLAEKYALLDKARLVAIHAGDPTLALQAAAETISYFRVDAVKLQSTTVEQLAQAVRTSAARRQLANAALALVEFALSEDRYLEAVALSSAARSAATALTDRPLMRKSLEVVKRVQGGKKYWDAYQAALAVLKKSPDDAASHLIVGRYLCVARRRWKEGLEHLSKVSDPPLKQLAIDDLAAPSDPQQQANLGHRWFELAESADEREKKAYQAAALYWYERALPKLTGLSKLKVENRLKNIGALSEREKRLDL